MIHCTGILAEHDLGSYIEGTLPEDEALRFEEHYFDCPDCLARVQALQAVVLQLRKQPLSHVKAPAPWPIRLGALLALAAMLVVSLFVLRARHQAIAPQTAAAPATPAPQSAPAPSISQSAPAALAQLADLSLPSYRASQLRGEGRNPQFETGMAAYAAHDCAKSLKALAGVPSEDEDAGAAHFYSGVCLFHRGDMAAATQKLRSVVAAGDSPQQEASLYYLAQIALRNNDATAAGRYLSRAIRLHGDFEARAKNELSRMRAIEAK